MTGYVEGASPLDIAGVLQLRAMLFESVCHAGRPDFHSDSVQTHQYFFYRPVFGGNALQQCINQIHLPQFISFSYSGDIVPSVAILFACIRQDTIIKQ
jgi:hypothetical protein